MAEKTYNIICIVCPLSCEMRLMVKDGKIESIKGNRCRRGIDYARQEFYNPQRVLTTTVKLKGDRLPLLPVRTNKPIPRRMLKECVKYLSKIEVKAPVRLGEVIVSNILNSGANVISTKEVGSTGVYRKT
ncbi:MAG TPA: DUF1667 domain-containing protein [Candidatus Aerophobetes bacterium]|uniref:DUF1667 domain-containing protein n=1 Tax=Aerophobetes bacterium TaxID=2030807 RepID=A0A7V0N2M1_UNCAE|nr:DUF1667 domain-containing protein [Candidatus Aerophobetes bacterium]